MFDLRLLRNAQSSSALLRCRMLADARKLKGGALGARTVGSKRVLEHSSQVRSPDASGRPGPPPILTDYVGSGSLEFQITRYIRHSLFGPLRRIRIDLPLEATGSVPPCGITDKEYSFQT